MYNYKDGDHYLVLRTKKTYLCSRNFSAIDKNCKMRKCTLRRKYLSAFYKIHLPFSSESLVLDWYFKVSKQNFKHLI